MPTDARQVLLDRARGGDEAARGELLETFRPYVRVIVQAVRRGRLSSRLDDSDLVQDALLAAHRAFDQFRGGTVPELAGWLRQLAVHAAGRAIRGQAAGKRGAGLDVPLDGLPEPPASNATPAGKLARIEESARVAAALDRLPDDMRQVLIARHFNGTAYADLAAEMKRTEGALRILYVRALRKLRDECGVTSG